MGGTINLEDYYVSYLMRHRNLSHTQARAMIQAFRDSDIGQNAQRNKEIDWSGDYQQYPEFARGILLDGIDFAWKDALAANKPQQTEI